MPLCPLRIIFFAATVLVAAAGCSPRVDVLCNSNADCKSVERCLLGECRPLEEGTEGEGEGEGEGEADPVCVVTLPDTTICGGPCMVSDGFDGGLGLWRDVSSAGTVAIENSVLAFSGDSEVVSAAPILLAGSAVQIALDSLPSDPIATVSLELRAGASGQRHVSLLFNDGKLYGSIEDRDTGTLTETPAIPHSLNDGEFLRIREGEGHILFERSTDAVIWTELASLADLPFVLDTLTVSLQLRASGSLDTWRVAGVAEDRIPCLACSLSDLHDTLCDGAAGPLFREIDNSNSGNVDSCILTEGVGSANAGLNIHIGSADDDVQCYYQSRLPYALDGGFITLPLDIAGTLADSELEANIAPSLTIRHPDGATAVGALLAHDGNASTLSCGVFSGRVDGLQQGDSNTIDAPAIEALRVSFDVANSIVVCTVEYAGDSWTVNGTGIDLAPYNPGRLQLGIFAFNALPRGTEVDLVVKPF